MVLGWSPEKQAEMEICLQEGYWGTEYNTCEGMKEAGLATGEVKTSCSLVKGLRQSHQEF